MYSSCAELDLEPRLPRAGTAREDVEDQLGAVDHLDVERLLEVPHLRRRQIVVEDHEIGLALRGLALDLLELPLADEGGGVDAAAALDHAVDHLGAGGVGEQRQLLERAVPASRRRWRRGRPGARAPRAAG